MKHEVNPLINFAVQNTK